jgi:starch synthase
MYVVMIASECAPIAKVGGLGDVVHGLSRELSLRGQRVDIVLPKYDCLQYQHLTDLRKVPGGLWAPYHGQWIHCDIYSGVADGLNFWLIEPHSEHRLFHRGKFYGDEDDVERFAFFSRAAMEFLFRTNKSPDVIHCHDWQTALVPVILYEIYENYGMTHPRVCFTIHNAGHQGVTGPETLYQVGLDPRRLMTTDRLEDHTHRGAINLLKGGIVFSNFVTTVSPRHADELRYTDQGRGLQPSLIKHSAKFGGILNGLDYDVWNPEIDPLIAANYSAESLPEKLKNKHALRHRLMLADAFKPIVAVVSRLDRQKGSDLLQHAADCALASNSQFVLLGTATEEAINAPFRALRERLNDHPDCHIELEYNDELAHQVYAGTDMIVVPSSYEPCGLTQMIAMKYGAVPIVRSTGGLADTVFDANYSERDFYERNGYAFHDYSTDALDAAMQRAIGLWHQYPEYFRQLRLNGMRWDYSWRQPAQHYQNIYDYLRH